MARPRKALSSSDPLVDLQRKTEILEREMTLQRAAMEKLQQISKLRAEPLRIDDQANPAAAKRRAAR
jgi:hypothetical protein